MRGTVSADRHYAILDLRPQITDLNKRAKPIETYRGVLQLKVSIPDGKTFLMKVPYTKYRTTGIRRVRDPDTGKTVSKIVEEIFTSPAPGQLYVLVKPTIIKQQDVEIKEERIPPNVKTSLPSPLASTTLPATQVKVLNKQAKQERRKAYIPDINIGKSRAVLDLVSGKMLERPQDGTSEGKLNSYLRPSGNSTSYNAFI